jgi:hypothetical protein
VRSPNFSRRESIFNRLTETEVSEAGEGEWVSF